MYNAVGAADIRRSIVPGYLTANENSFSLPSLSPSLSFSFSLPVFSRPTYSSLLFSLSIPRARSLYRYSFLPYPPSIATPFFPSFPPLFPLPPPRIIIDLRPRTSPGPSFHCISFVSSHSRLFLSSSSPSPSVVRDNSLVCSLITLRVYTSVRTK